ncbi:hypothetical protein C8024_10665, partial [Sphingopyxis sp. BSNA05]|nr:hypothetical protein [Sphingopyxis sp. BSNA05]
MAQHDVSRMWTSLTGTSGGSFEQHWYPGVGNEIVKAAALNLQPHYIKTFRLVSTRLAEFESEYPIASADGHLIDQLSELERPNWDQQQKKEDFANLESFVRELLEDDEVSIEIASNKTHIIVNANGRHIPLEALGSGIHEVFMLAAEIVLNKNSVILLEEPETHLHPALQKKLMMFLSRQNNSQFFITTHSNAIIDAEKASVFYVDQIDNRATVTPLLTNQEKYNVCRNLGYKASDLLQSNCVIWVEGPSDRIYLNDWIAKNNSALLEGIHYSIMFYGG